VVDNDVSDDGDAGRRESDVTSSDDHITMSFMMGDTPVNLELERSDNVPQLRSYYTAEYGKLVQWTLDQGQVNLLTRTIYLLE